MLPRPAPHRPSVKGRRCGNMSRASLRVSQPQHGWLTLQVGEERPVHATGPTKADTPVTNPAAASQECPALCRRSDAKGGSRGTLSLRAAALPLSRTFEASGEGAMAHLQRVHPSPPLPTAATGIWFQCGLECEPSLISGRLAPEITTGRPRGSLSLPGLAPLPQSHEWNDVNGGLAGGS